MSCWRDESRDWRRWCDSVALADASANGEEASFVGRRPPCPCRKPYPRSFGHASLSCRWGRCATGGRGTIWIVLLRLLYLAVINIFGLIWLLPVSDHVKEIEILALRHRFGMLQRQLGGRRPRFRMADRALLATLPHRLPVRVLRPLRLLVAPDTVLRWHRDLLSRRHAARSRPKRPGRPRTVCSVWLLGAAAGEGEPVVGLSVPETSSGPLASAFQ